MLASSPRSEASVEDVKNKSTARTAGDNKEKKPKAQRG